MQICNLSRLFLTYFPSARIKPQRAESDKQSLSFITELFAAAALLPRGQLGPQEAGSGLIPNVHTFPRDLDLQRKPGDLTHE